MEDVRLGNATLDALAEALADVSESLVEGDEGLVLGRLLQALLNGRFAGRLQAFRRQVCEERLEAHDKLSGLFGVLVLVGKEALGWLIHISLLNKWWKRCKLSFQFY